MSNPCASNELKKPDSCAMVVFGAHGDLTKRKLIPALYHLELQNLLPDKFAFVGNSRTELSSEKFRETIRKDFRKYVEPELLEEEKWKKFTDRFHYVAGDVADVTTFSKLNDKLKEVGASAGTGDNVLFYLATSPSFFVPVVQGLHEVGLTKEEGAWRRFIFEKPFGTDLRSARELNRRLGELLQEKQIFRIDHYLGKETVQNIMVHRFANGIFEPIWNRNFIESVDILVAETLGMEDRGAYYDTAGALRDMVPNHLFQVLSLIAMEPPTALSGDTVRDEKNKALRAIRPYSRRDVFRDVTRGQYGPGVVGGEDARDYRHENKVKPDSNTETFVSLKLFIDNWRWAGVPFRLTTGKRLPKRVSEVRIRFRHAPYQMFRGTDCRELESNELVLQLQPEEKISLSFGAKMPGPSVVVQEVTMDFDYAKRFGRMPSTGYESLIYDALVGDATPFMRADQIESAWAIVDPILEAWASSPSSDFPNYAAGSWGPTVVGSMEHGFERVS